MNKELEALARSLTDAWRTSKPIPLPPSGAAPATRADAYTVQDRIAELLAEPVVGWKVGAAIRAVQVLEGHDGPIPGRLFASRMFINPAVVPAELFDGYKIESEFAFRFREPAPARSKPWTREEIAPLIVFHPGLEIAGSRYVVGEGDRKFNTFDAIADNGAGGAYVVGDGVDGWTGIDFEHMEIDARIDGGAPIFTYTGELRQDPVGLVVETVNGLRSRGIGMANGDLVSTGSSTMPTALRRGQTYVARFGDLTTLSVSIQDC